MNRTMIPTAITAPTVTRSARCKSGRGIVGQMTGSRLTDFKGDDMATTRKVQRGDFLLMATPNPEGGKVVRVVRAESVTRDGALSTFATTPRRGISTYSVDARCVIVPLDVMPPMLAEQVRDVFGEDQNDGALLKWTVAGMPELNLAVQATLGALV